jgi:hypothetical protein
MAPGLLQRCVVVAADLPLSVVLAHTEFEAWFVASAASLAGARGLIAPLPLEEDPEGIPSPKGWIARHMAQGRVYSETLDQPALTQLMDLDQARRAPSFDKLYRAAPPEATAVTPPRRKR